MILTKDALKERIETGHIVALPEMVQENSINFRLGPDMWCVDDPWWKRLVRKIFPSAFPVNLHKDRPYRRVWGKNGMFTLLPGRMYLGTTLEDIGTRLHGDGVAIVPECRARSTMGRSGLTVAMCAGVGDVGYAGRWALEIVNMNSFPVKIRVGTEVGQMVFHEATPTEKKDAYNGPNRYQNNGKIRFFPKPFEIPK